MRQQEKHIYKYIVINIKHTRTKRTKYKVSKLVKLVTEIETNKINTQI